MDNTKLTVRVPADFLEGAKRYATRHNTTLTRLVTEYLRRLAEGDEALKDAPIVRRLTGVLPEDASVDEYREHLGAKYGG